MGSLRDDARSRVLVWGLSNNRAGTEMVIYNYAKNAPDVSFDFLCYEEPLNFSDLFSANNKNRYFVIPIKLKRPIAYMRALRSFMRKHGHEYSTLWFNVNDVSNIDLLKYAEKLGIERRITHIHNSNIPDKLITKLFSKLNWRSCNEATTERWACGECAGRFLYGSQDFEVIPNRVDEYASRFSEEERKTIRTRHGIEDSWVIGTLGRLSTQKNQDYLLELMPDVVSRAQNAILLIVGDGRLRNELEAKSRALGVEDNVIFAGSQRDIGSYLSAMDVFVLPSHYEGLSLSILEAQFNGLPCVTSMGVSRESIISTGFSRIPLGERIRWVDALLSANRESVELASDAMERFGMRNIKEEAGKMFPRNKGIDGNR